MILVDGQPGNAIGALDRGLAYGDGVFRTMRARAGCIALWPEHLRALARDCGRLALACPTEEALRADIARILEAEPDCVVKVIVTRGQSGRGYAIPPHARPSRIVASFEPPAPPPGRIEHGVRVRWCSTRLADQPALAGAKHLNRLENVLARSEWSDPAIAEGLMCDGDGAVIAGTASNVFILEGGQLVTPPLTRCGVEGVQRERLIALAATLCGGCILAPVSRERLLAADQVYLLNSVIGAWWVGALEERRWSRCALTPAVLEALDGGDA